jgi:hypothetical protein
MESNKNLTGNPSTTGAIGSTGTTGATGSPGLSTGQTASSASAPQRAREQGGGGGVQGAYDTTRQAVTNAYDTASQAITNTYDQAMTYGRENPGKLTLIAFGAGIGIGLLLSATLGGGRSRTNRIAEPVVNALSQVALEFFR